MNINPSDKHNVVRFLNFGSSDQLRMENLPKPVPDEYQILVKIVAVGINPIDWKIRDGFRMVPLPFIPGSEASGIIHAVGKKTEGFKIGQAVYGAIDHCYAEYAVASPEFIFIKPEHLTFEEAAAAGGGKTAWGALFDVGQLKHGQRVLIHGASGGVGVFAVQLAHQAGAYVSATASPRNVMTVRALGADEVFNYQENFEPQPNKYDLILDCVGDQRLVNVFPTLKKDGCFVTIVSPPLVKKAEQSGIKAAWGGTKTTAAMAEIANRLKTGKIKPVVSTKFHTLSEAAQAQDFSKYGQKPAGKIVLTI